MRNRVFIKVQDGCNNFCSYCIVPYLRGRSRSRNIAEIVNEVKSLPPLVKEVVLTGIDLSSFYNLGQLCIEIDKCGRAFRLSSIEARIISREFLNTLKVCKNFCPSFHVPLQSGSDDILRAMNRKYTAKEYLQKINLVRSVFPESQITTDIICGFPGEAQADFDKTADVVRSVRFLHAHIFPYSVRSGTRAADMQQLQSNIITERTKKLIETQKQITKEIAGRYKNKTLNVLFEYQKNGFTFGTSREYLQVKAKGSYPLEWQEIIFDGASD